MDSFFFFFFFKAEDGIRDGHVTGVQTCALPISAADTMDEVNEIHISVGSVDAPAVTGPPIAVSYSIQTVIEEATQNAALFTDRKLTFVPPLSHAVQVDFPAPVGRKWPACTIHSELATLPRSYKSKGLRECSFRIAFADA